MHLQLQLLSSYVKSHCFLPFGLHLALIGHVGCRQNAPHVSHSYSITILQFQFAHLQMQPSSVCIPSSLTLICLHFSFEQLKIVDKSVYSLQAFLSYSVILPTPSLLRKKFPLTNQTHLARSRKRIRSSLPIEP